MVNRPTGGLGIPNGSWHKTPLGSFPRSSKSSGFVGQSMQTCGATHWTSNANVRIDPDMSPGGTKEGVFPKRDLDVPAACDQVCG